MLAFLHRFHGPERQDEQGYAVRLNWRNGEHHIGGFARTVREADKQRQRSIRAFRRGPERPVSYAVVATTLGQVRTHCRLTNCRRVECPAVDVAPQAVPEGPR